ALADMQESRGDAAAAARAVDDGLARCAKASSAPELWARRIVLAERTGGEAARGEVLVRRAERLPDDATAQREAAEWLAGGGGDPRAAARLAARALELAPDDPLALAAMARVELALGTPRKALELVEKAIRIDPHDPQLRELRLRIALAAAESREAGP
ncbi:MAG: tetratricopeptide repeat protein, partial [Acidobacteria bacterium]|nr:tetratricopeptide repeat protein [Acidobacteriota bacterium]